MWEAIRALRVFTALELRGALPACAGVSVDVMRAYVTGLVNAGYLAREGTTYTLARDTGVEAPRVRNDGGRVTTGAHREQVWRTLKIIGEFCLDELAIHASTEQHPLTRASVTEYIRHLRRAGYLIVKDTGGGGRPKRYRLLPARYSGPRPPQVRHAPGAATQVFDPNLNRVVWPQDEQP